MLCRRLGDKDPLHTLMRSVSGIPATKNTGTKPYWAEGHYQLQRSSIYNSMSEIQKNEVVLRLNRWSLELIYFIEKFGLNYGARMIELAESEEEKSLYSLFAGDEVRHRLMIEPFLLGEHPQNLNLHPLLSALNLCLQQGSKESMTFTIQVILEGFGLMHYSQLRDSCLNPELALVFNDIIKDEVGHHGMGVVLTKKSGNLAAQNEQIIHLTHNFVRSLIEADWVTKSLEITAGHLSHEQKVNLKQETFWHKSQSLKIEKMSQLISKTGNQDLCEKLHSLGSFDIKA